MIAPSIFYLVAAFSIVSVLTAMTAAIAVIRRRLRNRRQTNPLAVKKCPNCAEQLAISALMCDECNYNFLSQSMGSRSKLLPPPEAWQTAS